MSLGAHVVYRASKDHHTKTITGTKKDEKGQEVKDKDGKPINVEVEGSVHHRELREFAGLVTRERAGKPATFDIVIFPPGANPVHVENVAEGTDEGEIEFA